METVRWGMIGCGEVTEIKSGPGFHKAEKNDLKNFFGDGSAAKKTRLGYPIGLLPTFYIQSLAIQLV